MAQGDTYISDSKSFGGDSKPRNPPSCGSSGNLAPSTRKPLAIAIVRFWCAKGKVLLQGHLGAGVCPPPRGGPWKPLLRVSVVGRLSASLRSVLAIVYGIMWWSCLVCKLSLVLLALRGGEVAERSLGSQFRFWILQAIALPGAVTLVGELRLLGTKVPWSDSPEKRGGPWAPPPRGVFLKAVLLCVCYLVRVWALCLGNLKKVWCFGTSILVRLPFKLLAL